MCKREDLKEVSKPLVKFLKENYHPHVIAIVTTDSVEILEGIENIPEMEESENNGM